MKFIESILDSVGYTPITEAVMNGYCAIFETMYAPEDLPRFTFAEFIERLNCINDGIIEQYCAKFNPSMRLTHVSLFFMYVLNGFKLHQSRASYYGSIYREDGSLWGEIRVATHQNGESNYAYYNTHTIYDTGDFSRLLTKHLSLVIRVDDQWNTMPHNRIMNFAEINAMVTPHASFKNAVMYIKNNLTALIAANEHTDGWEFPANCFVCDTPDIKSSIGTCGSPQFDGKLKTLTDMFGQNIVLPVHKLNAMQQVAQKRSITGADKLNALQQDVRQQDVQKSSSTVHADGVGSINEAQTKCVYNAVVNAVCEMTALCNLNDVTMTRIYDLIIQLKPQLFQFVCDVKRCVCDMKRCCRTANATTYSKSVSRKVTLFSKRIYSIVHKFDDVPCSKIWKIIIEKMNAFAQFVLKSVGCVDNSSAAPAHA